MTPEQTVELRKPFDPALIGKLPKGGVMLDFVGHAAVTDRLLRVDPEWTWEPFAVDQQGLPALDREGNLWIHLTIGGVTRPGVGDGKNMKERIGDALRNAAMRFGVAIDLWAKQDLHADQEAPSAPPAVTEVPPLRMAQARAWNAISALYPQWTQDERVTETAKVLAERNVTPTTATVEDWKWAATGWEDEKASAAA